MWRAWLLVAKPEDVLWLFMPTKCISWKVQSFVQSFACIILGCQMLWNGKIIVQTLFKNFVKPNTLWFFQLNFSLDIPVSACTCLLALIS